MDKEKHNFEFKYKLLLMKNYFDAGIGLTSYMKYIIGLFALYEVVKLDNYFYTIMFALIYAILCFFIGWAFFKYRWYEAQQEVSNRFNPFVKEVRKKLNGKRFK